MLRHAVRTLVSFVLALAALHTSAADRTCTDEEKAAANKLLFLNQRDQNASVATHLPWGAPTPSGSTSQEKLFAHRDYVIRYSETLRVPLWTGHRLVAKGLNATPDRVNCFRQDPRVDSPKASLPRDYDEPDYDQGHLVPSEDMSHSLSQNVNSFIMSNMAPQYGPFNRIIWNRLEAQVRTWARAYRTLHVVSGSVFDHDGNGQPDAESAAKRMKSRNGDRRVAIPSHFYKIVVRKCSNGDLGSLAFMLPNDKVSHTGAEGLKYLEKHVTSIASIEGATGLEFFRDATANGKIDRTRAHDLWPLKPGVGDPKCGDL